LNRFVVRETFDDITRLGGRGDRDYVAAWGETPTWGTEQDPRFVLRMLAFDDQVNRQTGMVQVTHHVDFSVLPGRRVRIHTMMIRPDAAGPQDLRDSHFEGIAMAH